MNKVKIVISALWYPLTMATYFVKAFERRKDVELVTCGPFSGSYIPWKNGMNIPQKYVTSPTIPLPYPPNMGGNPSIVQAKLPWTPDIWIQIDAGWHFTSRPEAGQVVCIGTDPHVLDYTQLRKMSDIFFNMQAVYAKAGDVYLPYAFDPTIHYPMKEVVKKYDACLVGLQYENRNRLVNMLRSRGLKVFYETGLVFDEFRQVYNESRVALNWSSLDDLNARTFEAFGMGLPLVTNRVTDLPSFFVENEHYLGFSSVGEAADKVQYLLSHKKEATILAEGAYRKALAGHTYDIRVSTILTKCGANR